MSSEQQLLRILDKIFEGRGTDAHRQQLNELLGQYPDLIDIYCNYTALHGALHWDTGMGSHVDANDMISPDKITTCIENSKAPVGRGSKQSRIVAICSMLALSLVAIVGWQLLQDDAPNPVLVAPSSEANEEGGDKPSSSVLVAANEPTNDSQSPNSNDDLKPLNTQVALPGNRTHAPPSIAVTEVPRAASRFGAQFSDSDVVQTINELLQQSWTNQEVKPSQRADDSEWVRRAYLVYAGRIPGIQEIQAFRSVPKTERRSVLIDQLTQNDEVPEYLADVWTQLMIGRTNRPGVNRPKLQEYLVTRFSNDEPWIDTVTDLITARGRNDRNGATNFLLAHLNNQATPATAVTARLFLGQQISCVQCHDHPFAKGIQQRDYWALNAFFKDTQKVSVGIADADKKKAMPDLPWKLEDRPENERMTYFENRSGLSIGVLPTFDGQTLDHRSVENRRIALAKLLATDSANTVARAMVNRMWAHFFGYGFTNPIDDMGPHVPVSHPELLDALTEAFVKSDYSLKRLMKWIALSDAWHRSSQQVQTASAESTATDAPEVGEVPLFSRVYARRMSPEQVYESIRVAIQSVGNQSLASRQEHAVHRRDWVRQFATAYGTDENDESMDFEGTISQAMVMMNGSEINDAIRTASTIVVKNNKGATTKALEALAKSLLARNPTDAERKAFRRHVQQLKRQNPKSGQVIAIEDMLWAYLNSTEFMTVH
ncbi:MAG: DUF1553 domain-containing protein [Fuerstiella sp.]